MFLPALLLLVGVPVLELYLIVRVGEAIGVLPTVALLVATSLLGVRLMRSQGRAVIRNFSAAVAAGRPPGREALDGVLVFVGGALLMAPGFATDVVGAGMLAPPTRALLRRWIVRHHAGRVITWIAGAPGRTRNRRGGASGRAEPPRSGGYDVDGTAVDVNGTAAERDRHQLDR
jgi:UPF0716 protein FxsA